MRDVRAGSTRSVAVAALLVGLVASCSSGDDTDVIAVSAVAPSTSPSVTVPAVRPEPVPEPPNSTTPPETETEDFFEDFTGNVGLEHFETGVYHRDEVLVSSTEWSADHDADCGDPSTQRPVHRDEPDEAFYLCRDHLMTSVGDTSGYSIAWFSPRKVFHAGSDTVISFDVNVTDLGKRQWWEVSVVPVGAPFLATVDWIAQVAHIDAYADGSIVVGNGPYGGTASNIVTEGQQRNPLDWRHVCGDLGVDPEGCASKAIRRTFTITDNLDGTVTFDYLGMQYTYPGEFPEDFEVYFKDHTYTPDKDGVPAGYTWHWDTISIH